MIELSEQDYRRLLDGRNALGQALQHLATEVEKATASDAERAHGLADAIKHAQAVLAEYGEHQGFVLM